MSLTVNCANGTKLDLDPNKLKWDDTANHNGIPEEEEVLYNDAYLEGGDLECYQNVVAGAQPTTSQSFTVITEGENIVNPATEFDKMDPSHWQAITHALEVNASSFKPSTLTVAVKEYYDANSTKSHSIALEVSGIFNGKTETTYFESFSEGRPYGGHYRATFYLAENLPAQLSQSIADKTNPETSDEVDPLPDPAATEELPSENTETTALPEINLEK